MFTALACATAVAVSTVNTAYAAEVTSPTRWSGVAGPAACIRGEREKREVSAVDEGEIRFTEATKYDDARKHAGKVWQGSWAKIKIRDDSGTTVNDLEWRDYSKADGHAGYYNQRSAVAATDYIYLNKKYLDKPGKYHSAEHRRHVAAHELGHALGLCHKPDTVVSIMWTKAPSTLPLTGPTTTDKANYTKLWGTP